MKKTFIYILIAIAAGLMIFNATKIDLDGLMEGDSGTALITLVAAACVVVLLVILLVSMKIAKKVK
ncbi:hypothetical protein ACFQO1_08985 [Jejudonia soesokkakensis]|uniref:Uncharacterized protein n=1 Tax=Jejudonia soesokkakensis TaxID=1323432 RepID=A0ABW2MVR0_9FLAO